MRLPKLRPHVTAGRVIYPRGYETKSILIRVFKSGGANRSIAFVVKKNRLTNALYCCSTATATVLFLINAGTFLLLKARVRDIQTRFNTFISVSRLHTS